MEHKYIHLHRLKSLLKVEYSAWCHERDIRGNDINEFGDVFEFLLQMGFIQGKKFLKYIDETPDEQIGFRPGFPEPLREGFYLPNTLIGPKPRE